MKAFASFVVAILMAVVITLSAPAGAVSWTPGVTFSGSPSYVSEFPTQFRDNGGPLSPFGSHFGVKAEVRKNDFAGVLHYACSTGVFVYDYSRTGLVGASSIRFLVGGAAAAPKSRDIRFAYYGWTETAVFDRFSAEARVQFLALDTYVISACVTNTSDAPLTLTPELVFTRNGKRLALDRSSRPDDALLKLSVQPTVYPLSSYLAVRPSIGAAATATRGGGGKLLQSDITLAPGQLKWFWFVFGFSPDGGVEARALAKQGFDAMTDPESAWAKMTADRDAFFARLPAPHLAAGDTNYLDLYRMAATALDNALYAPRGKMTKWACVPTKVHYNWFWLWDSGFQTLGYSETDPVMAREVVESIFAMQEKNGFIAHMEDENQKGITPHSQPPVFGFSLPRVIERHPDDPKMATFRDEIYRLSKPFIGWWKKARDVNRNGLFEYLSQDEGGWDNSPRAAYVPRLAFISYYGMLGELIGAKVKPLDNADLNAWMYLYFRAMGDWAEEMGKADEAAEWLAQADALAGKVDEILWDDEIGCWLDTYSWLGSKKYHHFRTLTPHIWFPAFAGATKDERKARRVIEEHLLNPKEFWGKYPIPIVAYNDKYYTREKPGWYSSIWMIGAYSALETLWRFGYEAEAQELRSRLLAMMAEQDGMKAIYETYDPETGKYKNEWTTGGYASQQFGWSSAFTMEMILERYQENRFVFADTKKIFGFIRRAEAFDGRAPFYRVAAGMSPPRVELWSDEPLLQAKSVKMKLSDPYGSAGATSFAVTIGGQTVTVPVGEERVIEL